jgi:hypothetical protein
VKTNNYHAIHQEIEELANNALELMPEEFFRLRKQKGISSGNKYISTESDFAGVYILYNHTIREYNAYSKGYSKTRGNQSYNH